MRPRQPLGRIQETALITLAVGNSNTRIVLWNEAGDELAVQCKPTVELLEELKNSADTNADASALSTAFPMALAGPVPGAVDAIERHYLALDNIEVLRFRKNLPCTLRVVPHPAEQVGDDRLAACLGAWAISPENPWIVIDAGTALTINVVRPDAGKESAVFEGGVIAPGEALSLQALHRGTDQLPALKPWPHDKTAPALGCSTEEAIRAGVRQTQLAVAMRLIAMHLERFGSKTRIAATGGGARGIYGSIEETFASQDPIYDPVLVNRGLFAAWSLAQEDEP